MPIASPRYPFTRSSLAGAPNDPGIYALFQNDELLFYGLAVGAGTIQSKLIAHMSGVIDPDHATHYAWEIARFPEQRLDELLAEYKALHGRVPKFNRQAPEPPSGIDVATDTGKLGQGG
jgi:hypothetical protein